MKKKFKLFTTIGSLALAICMMTIGVLAANNVSLSVTSTVKFGATSTYVDFTGTVSGGDLAAAKTITVKNYETTDAASKDTFTGTGEGFSSNTWTIGNINFVEESTKSGGQVITYVFTIENPLAEGGAGLKVVITPTIPSDIKQDTTGSSTSDVADYTVSYQTKDGEAQAVAGQATALNNIAGGDSVIVTYTLTLNNVAASLKGGTVKFDFDFSRV